MGGGEGGDDWKKRKIFCRRCSITQVEWEGEWATPQSTPPVVQIGSNPAPFPLLPPLFGSKRSLAGERVGGANKAELFCTPK